MPQRVVRNGQQLAQWQLASSRQRRRDKKPRQNHSHRAHRQVPRHHRMAEQHPDCWRLNANANRTGRGRMNDDYGNTSHSGNSRARPFSPWQGGEGGRRPDEGANIAAIQKFPLTLTLSPRGSSRILVRNLRGERGLIIARQGVAHNETQALAAHTI